MAFTSLLLSKPWVAGQVSPVPSNFNQSQPVFTSLDQFSHDMRPRFGSEKCSCCAAGEMQKKQSEYLSQVFGLQSRVGGLGVDQVLFCHCPSMGLLANGCLCFSVGAVQMNVHGSGKACQEMTSVVFPGAQAATLRRDQLRLLKAVDAQLFADGQRHLGVQDWAKHGGCNLPCGFVFLGDARAH